MIRILTHILRHNIDKKYSALIGIGIIFICIVFMFVYEILTK